MTRATGMDTKATTDSAAPGFDPATRRVKLLIVGVGGQGILTAAKILGAAAHGAGLPVVVGQLHGMTQRGGTVECPVLFGDGDSSFITGGPADAVAAFEPLEALRALPAIGPHTRVLLNLGTIVPFEVTRARIPYPRVDEIVAKIRTVTAHLVTVDGPGLLKPLGVPRTLNVMMLGALCGLGLLPFDTEALRSAVERCSPPKFREANERALQVGLGLKGQKNLKGQKGQKVER